MASSPLPHTIVLDSFSFPCIPETIPSRLSCEGVPVSKELPHTCDAMTSRRSFGHVALLLTALLSLAPPAFVRPTRARTKDSSTLRRCADFDTFAQFLKEKQTKIIGELEERRERYRSQQLFFGYFQVQRCTEYTARYSVLGHKPNSDGLQPRLLGS